MRKSYLAESTSHAGLETISACTGQHLYDISTLGNGRENTVDSDDVVGMASDSHVEGILATNLGQVLVGTDTASLKGLGRKLFILVGDKMDTEREVVNTGLFAAQVEDSDLGMSQTWMQKKESTLESGTPRL